LKKIIIFNAYLLFYPTLFWTIVLGRVLKLRNWWDEIDDCVILGAIPFNRDVSSLKEMGVKCIINLCAESEGPVRVYKEYNIDYFELPTADFTCPDIENIEKGVSIIEQYKNKNEKVYVHCKAGRGRSATIVFCWLVCSRKYSLDDAMELLISKRPQVNRELYKREIVKKYIKQNSH